MGTGASKKPSPDDLGLGDSISITANGLRKQNTSLGSEDILKKLRIFRKEIEVDYQDGMTAGDFG